MSEKIWVKVPSPTDPALTGQGMLRRSGPRRSRMVESPEEILAGIQGSPIETRPKFKPDYFTEEVEEVELDRWVMRKLVNGSLVRVANPSLADPDIITSAPTAEIEKE